MVIFHRYVSLPEGMHPSEIQQILEPNDKGFDGQFLQYDWGWKNHEKSMNTHYPAQKHGKTGS